MHEERYVPTGALHKSLVKAQGTCVTCGPQIEWLEEMAKVEPAIDEQVNELRLKHEHINRLSRVGLNSISADTQIPSGG
jgi:hypothetical protein